MSSRPDPDRLGGIGWARRTGGTLTPAERRRLLGAIAKGQVENVLGRIKLATGRLPAGAREVDVRRYEPPDSRFAKEAEEACAEQSPALIGHSYRTWLFGLALAELDRADLDREAFYAASLLHDHGAMRPTPGRDFTIASAERVIACAQAAGLSGDLAEVVGDAICVHATPGATPAMDGVLGCYVQWGAMVDAGGLRAWDITRENRDEVVRAHPRPGFKAELTRLTRAEAAAVPGGRFALLMRCGLPLLIRLAPFDD